MRRHSRKRKLTYDEIGKCHPGITRKKGQISCLPKKTYTTLRKKIGEDKCKVFDEHCLLDKSTALSHSEKEKLRTQYLRPRYPDEWYSDPDEWLDNFNIIDVMKQYEQACPWFRFMGVYPIDFSVQNPYVKDKKICLHPEICNLNLYTEYDKGVRALGFIFNLDPHYKGGSHWVGLYCDIHNLYSPKKHTWCAYFDSYGMKTPNYVATLMRYLYSQDHKMKLMFNARRFQYGGSECGMYSMYFIICMLNGIPFSKFCKDSVPDDFMFKMRELLFTR